MKLGHLIAVCLAVFAVVCTIASLDYARGRVPVTSSALILDVLSEGVAKQCRRDVTSVVQKHVRPGMPKADALKVISDAAITLPEPWFWTPSLTQGLVETGETTQATRTLRATAFGNELLRIEMKLKEGKVETLNARVECAFS